MSDNLILHEGIRMDRDAHTVTADGRPVDLTRKEWGLLELLLTNRGLTVSRQEILERVWGMRYPTDVQTRTVDVHIGRVREKLGAQAIHIKTIRTIGFRLGLPDNVAEAVQRPESDDVPAGVLSDRERDVLLCIVAGKSTKETAQLLEISAKTADSHRTRIMSKTGQSGAVLLTRWAIRQGLVQA